MVCQGIAAPEWKRQRARELRGSGATLATIADRLNMSIGWVHVHTHGEFVASRKRSYAPGVAGAAKLMREYKRWAAKRGYIWTISDEEFLSITKQRCHYCGAAPAQKMYGSNDDRKRKLKIPGSVLRSEYIYNGVDRRNNKQGYVSDNVVPCCGTCNQLKGRLSDNEFIQISIRVAEYQIAKRREAG